MANTLKVLFWLHRSKINKNGKVPIMVRLTYHSQKADKATGFYVSPDRWNTNKQRLKGSDKEENEVNDFLHSLITKSLRLFNEGVEKDDVYLPNIILSLFAKKKAEPTLLQTIEEHISNLKARVGKDYTRSTYEKYLFTKDKVDAFLEHRKSKDIRLRDLTTNFIIDFDHFLRTKANNQHNTAIKYCLNLKRVINVAVLRGLLPSNPFNSYKTVYKETQQIFLDQNELNQLRHAPLQKPKHLLARDMFLFQANTGLAYTDMAALENKDISTTDGQYWIVKARQKSDIVATIPILGEAIVIIEKYKEYKKHNQFLLPLISIQKYNQHLGEIGSIAGLSKKLSSHVGRRTFGNVALSKGVSINVISKILGHSNTLITQRIYAITTQRIILNEIQKLA